MIQKSRVYKHILKVDLQTVPCIISQRNVLSWKQHNSMYFTVHQITAFYITEVKLTSEYMTETQFTTVYIRPLTLSTKNLVTLHATTTFDFTALN